MRAVLHVAGNTQHSVAQMSYITRGFGHTPRNTEKKFGDRNPLLPPGSAPAAISLAFSFLLIKSSLLVITISCSLSDALHSLSHFLHPTSRNGSQVNCILRQVFCRVDREHYLREAD